DYSLPPCERRLAAIGPFPCHRAPGDYSPFVREHLVATAHARFLFPPCGERCGCHRPISLPQPTHDYSLPPCWGGLGWGELALIAFQMISITVSKSSSTW